MLTSRFTQRLFAVIVPLIAGNISTVASAVVPLGGASLIFQEHPNAGIIQLVVYEWDSNQWKKDGSVRFSSGGFQRLIPFPGAREFAFSESRQGGTLAVHTVNSLGIQISSSAKALGHTRDGYPLELTSGDTIKEYTSALQEQVILYTNPASLPVWGVGQYHQIGQLKGGEYVLAGDQFAVAFDPAQPTTLMRVELTKLRFETRPRSGIWHRVTQVLDLLPADDTNVWFLVETNKNRRAILLVNLKTGNLIDSFELRINNSMGVALIHNMAGYNGDELIFREGQSLKQRDATTGHTVPLNHFFEAQELARYGIPQTQTSIAIDQPVAWNWKADFYSYSLKMGARAAAALPPRTTVVPPLVQAPAIIVPPLPPVPVIKAPITAPISAPITMPLSEPLLPLPFSDPIAHMPEQLTRKAFLAFYRQADPEFKSAFQILLTPEGENALRRLGFSRYHTTIECTGDESALISREQVRHALVSLCSKALQNR